MLLLLLTVCSHKMLPITWHFFCQLTRKFMQLSAGKVEAIIPDFTAVSAITFLYCCTKSVHRSRELSGTEFKCHEKYNLRLLTILFLSMMDLTAQKRCMNSSELPYPESFWGKAKNSSTLRELNEGM